MNRVTVFDFDGTLTRKDTMIEFVTFVVGKKRMIYTFLFCLIPILFMKIGLLPNERVKSLFLFKALGRIPSSKMEVFGLAFAKRIDSIVRQDIVAKLNQHRAQGDKIYVVTASIDKWIFPWCSLHGIENVLSTQMDFDENGHFTGRFATRNCYGKEKVYRLLKAEPFRDSYYLTAYGDSRGDKEMISFADKGIWV